MCRQGFKGETSIHVHHIIERCQGGGDGLNNLVMLHPNCHRQVSTKSELIQPLREFNFMVFPNIRKYIE